MLSLDQLVLIEFSSVLNANHAVLLRVPRLEFWKSELWIPRYEVRSVCATAFVACLSSPLLRATPFVHGLACVFAHNAAAIALQLSQAFNFFGG